MDDSIKIDSEKLINLCCNMLDDVLEKLNNVEDKIVHQKIPVDPNLKNIDTSGLHMLLHNLGKSTYKVKAEIEMIANEFMRAEKYNQYLNNLYIGDELGGNVYYNKLESPETIRYENVDGGVVDSLAFYINGKLVAKNVNYTETNVRGAKIKYAKDYGVDISEVNVFFHVSNDIAELGWLNEKELKNDYNKVEKEIGKEVSKYESEYVAYANADYCKTEYVEIEGDKQSYMASLGHSIANIGIGKLAGVPFVSQIIGKDTIDNWKKNNDKLFYGELYDVYDWVENEKQKEVQPIKGKVSPTAVVMASIIEAGAETADAEKTEIPESGRILGLADNDSGTRALAINVGKKIMLISNGEVTKYSKVLNKDGENYILDADGRLVEGEEYDRLRDALKF